MSPPRSPRFRELEARCRELRRRFLPRQLSPTGTYTELQLDRARAYRLLVHAEFEAFIEDRASDIAKAAVASWTASKLATRPLLGLLAYAKTLVEPSVGSAPPSTSSMDKRLTLALSHFMSRIHENHGIKAANLAAVLMPIGIEDADFDPVWVSDMENFGTDRGKVAHQSSAAIYVNYTIDPATELSTANKLLAGLKHIDVVMTSL